MAKSRERILEPFFIEFIRELGILNFDAILSPTFPLIKFNQDLPGVWYKRTD